MGMFDKDKEIGLIITRFVELNEQFILWDARIVRDDFPTTLGPTPQSQLTVSKMAEPQDKYVTTTLASAIAAKVREAEPGDFPAVVQLARVESRFGNDALVVQFLKPYGRSADATDTPTAAPAPSPRALGDGDPDDIPF